MATGIVDHAAEPERPPARRRPPRWSVGLAAGVLATLVVVLVLGVGSASPLGAEDNGDGYRLSCGAGLTPLTGDELASWKGGVVTFFSLGPPTCADPVPSSALVIARAATLASSSTWALSYLGALYAVLVGLVAGLAAWAASAAGPRRAVVVAVPALPLALPAFSRFFVSTYSEPAGLLGTFAVGAGVAALLATRPEHRAARGVALALTAVGGVVAATAKVAYLPVLAAAVVACAVVALGAGRRRRVAGPVVALVTVLVAALPLSAALARQDAFYESVNTHNVVFTMTLLELGPSATGPLGLPAEAAAITGNGYFNGPPRPEADWWRRAILDDPARTRAAAHGLLAENPAVVARALGVGLQATTLADLPYLASTPADPGTPSPPSGHPGWSGARQPDLAQVLTDTRRPPWIPSALVVLSLLAAATARWQGPARRWSLAAGGAAVTAVGLVAVAVLGDGYFEVFKHVWLAAYLLVVAALCLAGGVVSRLRATRRPG